MIFAVIQVLGGAAACAGSVALFGPWWTLFVFGALTLLAASVAEALQNRPVPRSDTEES
jgi:membrane protein implicated in regulation of membrane protease activity